MLKEWAEDIRTKTKDMNGREKAEYVLTYYWYHILLGALFLGLVLLLIYHMGWGKREKEFSLVLVNQEVNSARDQALAEKFSRYSGIDVKKIMIDSNYLISYGSVQLEGINESSYEKFFFNWSAGSIDAVVMPESFLRYCKNQGGELTDLETFLEPEELEKLEDYIFRDNGKAEGIYIENTKLAHMVVCGQEDGMILVFPGEPKHNDACRKFLEFSIRD
ncbi:MAG: hypothetical protein ACI4EO_08055 [Blautia sp.]